jgi:hypothetical protein
VIDIPEDVYKRTVFYREFRDLNDCVATIKALEKGTQLPKGHGRLIDADALYNELEFPSKRFGEAFKEILDDAQTIIEADKAESEDKE